MGKDSESLRVAVYEVRLPFTHRKLRNAVTPPRAVQMSPELTVELQLYARKRPLVVN